MLRKELRLILVFIPFIILFISIFDITFIYDDIDRSYISKSDNVNYVYKDYNSYLVIDSLNINILIENGTSDVTLNKNVVGKYDNNSTYLKGQVILAGHNNKKVFKNLNNISIGDSVVVFDNNQKYVYYVYDKKIISYTDTSNFYITSSRSLVLITCIYDNYHRLLVFCK